MFEIQSYIKVNDEFIAIEDIKGNSVYKKMDKRSIEGAITIKYYTQILGLYRRIVALYYCYVRRI